MPTLRLAIVLLLTHLVVVGASKRLSKQFDTIDNNETVRVIVQFDKSLDYTSLNKVRAKFLNKVKEEAGLKKADLDLLNGGTYEIKAKHLEKLSKEEGIRFVTPDHEVRPALDHANTTLGASIARDYGWDGSGIIDHEDLDEGLPGGEE